MRTTVLASAVLTVTVSTSTWGAIVTSNNLATQLLGSLVQTPTNPGSNNPQNAAFVVSQNRLVGVTTNVSSTVTGSNIGPYAIGGISRLTTPTNAQLIGSDTIGLLSGAVTNRAQNILAVTNSTDTTLNYHLGVGRTADVKSFNWSWSATNVTAYRPGGADDGLIAGYGRNLVPNASFENTTVQFVPGAAYVADAGKHGSSVLQITGTADKHIGIPVLPGTTYAYSFWYNTVAGGGNNQVEWGLTVPADGFVIGAGNSTAGASTGWAERTGTFTPAAGQTMFYIGAMSNGGEIRMDSFYVAATPEPGSAVVLAAAGLLLVRRRRASA